MPMRAPMPWEGRLGALAAAIGKDTPRPSIYIDVTERHIGQPVVDPAVEAELAKICHQLGFKVIDRLQGTKAAICATVIPRRLHYCFSARRFIWLDFGTVCCRACRPASWRRPSGESCSITPARNSAG